jgi:deoxycytidine triphosphate deaminase
MAAPAFETVVPELGFLPDHRIADALGAGFLLEQGTWEANQIRHASYTLRLGHRVEVERGKDAQRADRQRLNLTLTNGGAPLELQPGDTALLYSLENLRLPPCVLGFTVARGLLFVESLVPENTYIDPGFRGSIYTTVTNLSGRVLELRYGTPIARLFFYRLASNVQHEYRTGPAIGIEQHLPSRPGATFTQQSARQARTEALLVDLEIERGGARTAELLRRQANIAHWALGFAIALPILLQIAASWSWLQQQLGPFMANVLSSVVAVPLVYFGQKVIARFRK